MFKGGIMSSLNKVILIGRLGADPVKRITDTGKPVTNFSMATTEQWQNGNGENQKKTEWHKIVLWNRQAEIAEQYLRKGSLVYIEGSLQTSKWEDQNQVSHYSTEVIGKQMQFLESRISQPSQISSPTQVPPPQPPIQQPTSTPDQNYHMYQKPPVDSFIEDDIPF
jgi:single-strand DNA-binding protein